MKKKTSSKQVLKAISLGLSVYMALTPVAVYADEGAEEDSSSESHSESHEEESSSSSSSSSESQAVEQAVESSNATEASQAVFESAVADVDVSNIDTGITIENTSEMVDAEISTIENEAVQEAVDSIVDVDMTDVNAALNQVNDIVDSAVTDESVAREIEATADTLIDIYDSQAKAALGALTVISEKMDAVTVKDDGSVEVDWNAATDEVTGLYNVYQAALAAKDNAQAIKDQATEKKEATTQKISDLNGDAIDNKSTASKAIADSKADKSDDINAIIAKVAERDSSKIAAKYSKDENVDGSSDVYRFYINKVENGTAYGCLTYYDSERKTILRKNFAITSDGIDCNYVPKAEWVKGDANCKSEVFGNGGNYIAAYIEDNTSKYVKSTTELQNGKDISDLMRNNVKLNDVIEAKNDLEKINELLAEKEVEIQTATKNAEDALAKYKEAVAMYKKAAELEREIKKDEVEKAKLEYVKAEVEAWRRQQVLDQINDAINNAGVTDKDENDSTSTEVSIETVVTSIASNLGVDPEAVEGLVAQTIINTEDNNDDTAVLGARRNTEKAPEAEATEAATAEIDATEEVESAETVVNKDVIEEAVESQHDEAQNIITIDENEVPLANVGAESNKKGNWWLALIAAITGSFGIFFAAAKKKKEDEEESK